MKKIDPLTAIFGLFIIIFLLYVNSQNINNVISIIFLVVFAFAFFSINTINSMVLKVAIVTILFFSIIAVTSFLYSSESIYPDYGINILLPQLDLDTNKEQTDAIPVSQIKNPSSPDYTYSFSTYVKNAPDTDTVTYPNKKYLFYRNGSTTSLKNIGLRLDKILDLHLDYTTYTTTNNVKSTTQQEIKITDTVKFPTNIWTTITITVYKDVINVYIGTTLKKSNKIDNLSPPDSTSPIEFGNMPAYLANFSYSPSIIEPTPSYIQYMTHNIQ